MRLVDRIVTVSMAPIGLALGSGGVLTLEFALIGSWAACAVFVGTIIVLDVIREIRGRPLATHLIGWLIRSRKLAARLDPRSRRARRAARNLFCSGAITGAMASAVFAPSLL